MIISRIGLLLAIAILLEFGGSSARAELIVGDLINPGDHSLVTDTATGLQWLSPVYTAGNSFDDSFVQNLITDDRFAYASEAQVEAMINANFDSPPVGSPGTAAGFADAAAFFDVFGIAASITCGGGPCPRTQGFTSTSSAAGYNDAVGMIELGSNGWMIEQNAFPDSNTDVQLGSWLVREESSSAPEPTSLGLFCTGVASLALVRKAKCLAAKAKR